MGIKFFFFYDYVELNKHNRYSGHHFDIENK